MYIENLALISSPIQPYDLVNSSFLKMYIHCGVLLSDKGVTMGSKSCNYNVIQSRYVSTRKTAFDVFFHYLIKLFCSRWEDLSGTAEVCKCCSSKCKGPSIKHLPDGQCFVAFVKCNCKWAISGPLTVSFQMSRLLSALAH